MHLIGIRRSIYEKNPWVAVNLLKAFVEAREHAMYEIGQIGRLVSSLPWSVAEHPCYDQETTMEIKNSFDIPLPAEDAWRVLLDIPRIAPCMPGAELIEQIDNSTYKGKVSVRLGPVALAFAGTAHFVEVDEANHRARVKAQGTDAKGRGSASATVNFQLMPAADMTRVEVTTDVNLTGAVAQYGRATGIIQNVAAELVSQFAGNLKRSLAAQCGNPPSQANAERKASTPSAASGGAVPGTPISAVGLIAQALWSAIRRLFGG